MIRINRDKELSSQNKSIQGLLSFERLLHVLNQTERTLELEGRHVCSQPALSLGARQADSFIIALWGFIFKPGILVLLKNKLGVTRVNKLISGEERHVKIYLDQVFRKLDLCRCKILLDCNFFSKSVRVTDLDCYIWIFSLVYLGTASALITLLAD